MVAQLGELSSKAVPGNATQQIRDWSGQCCRIGFSSAILLECPDAATALRALSVGGAKLIRLSETVLALKDRGALRTLEGKLRQAGNARQ